MKKPPPEKRNNGEESATSADSPITNFKRLTKRLLSVRREELKEAERLRKPKD